MGSRENRQVQQDRANAEQLLTLKDDILRRFESLPPEHQATMGLVLVKHITDGAWGEWLQDALIRQYWGNSVFPTVDRDVLRAARFTEAEVAQFSDQDLQSIGRHMREHYINDLFGDEVFFHAQNTLEHKRERRESTGGTDE